MGPTGPLLQVSGKTETMSEAYSEAPEPPNPENERRSKILGGLYSNTPNSSRGRAYTSSRRQDDAGISGGPRQRRRGQNRAKSGQEGSKTRSIFGQLF